MKKVMELHFLISSTVKGKKSIEPKMVGARGSNLWTVVSSITNRSLGETLSDIYGFGGSEKVATRVKSV